MGTPAETRERSTRNAWNNNAKLFSKLMPDTKPQIKVSHRALSSINNKNNLNISYSNSTKLKTEKKILTGIWEREKFTLALEE